MTELKDPTTHIVDAVAEAENAHAVELEPPLAEVVDPDALETLIEETTGSELEVHFTYRGHDVVVDENGQIQID